MREKRRRKRKGNLNKRVWIGLVVLTVLLPFAGTMAMGGQEAKETKTYYENVQIHTGDTLWDLAKEYKLDEKKTEQMVADIMELNAMSSSNIRAGEKIIIPIEKQI